MVDSAFRMYRIFVMKSTGYGSKRWDVWDIIDTSNVRNAHTSLGRYSILSRVRDRRHDKTQATFLPGMAEEICKWLIEKEKAKELQENLV